MNGSDIRYDCKPAVAKRATDSRSVHRYIAGMAISPLAQWVRKAVEKTGSQAHLGRLLSKELRREIDRAAGTYGDDAHGFDGIFLGGARTRPCHRDAHRQHECGQMQWVCDAHG